MIVQIQDDDELFSDKYLQKIFNNFNKFFVSYKVFNFDELENFVLANTDDYKKFYEMHDLEVEELDEKQQTQDQNLENDNSRINLTFIIL